MQLFYNTFLGVVQCHVLLWPLSRFVDKNPINLSGVTWLLFEIVEKYT